MSMADWRELSARWRRYGCCKLADDLDALLDRVEAVEKRLEAVRDYAVHHVDAEESDRLRKVLWPKRTA